MTRQQATSALPNKFFEHFESPQSVALDGTHCPVCSVLESAMLPTTRSLMCWHCASKQCHPGCQEGDLSLRTRIQINIAGTPALHRKLHCTTHLSFPQLTMVADQWLVDLDAHAEEAAWLRQQQNSHANDSHKAASLSDSSSGLQSNTEMSSFNEDPPVCGPMNIRDCWPSIEEHRAHVARRLNHLHSTSTRDQHARKHQEHKEFAREVVKNEEITVEGALKFLQFQAH